MLTRLSTVAGVILLCASVQAQQAEITSLLKIGPEAEHNAEAALAVAALSKTSPEALPQLLGAMNSANALASNYLRAAVEAVVDRTLSAKGKLPLPELRSFLAETRNNPRARRLAYEILLKVVPEEAAQLVPTFANDPSVELRYEAVDLLTQKADALRDAKRSGEAIGAYQVALGAARDQKQIEKIAGDLRALEVSVDLPKLFGFLTHWKVIGPFDNTDSAGFGAVFPPEQEFKPDAVYDGKSGKVRWIDIATGEDYGKVDLNPSLGELKEVTGYASCVFNSPIEGPAELRLGCKNGWKVWFNGAFLFGRDEYHRGARIDQYRLPVVLKKGENVILLKICQNADVKDWTREWEFQIRVCDSTGTAILATDRPPTPASSSKGSGRAAASKK